MEMLRRVHAENMVRWGKDHPEALVLSGDLTASCEVDAFRDAYPDRFFSMGLMEQNMISMAAGLARDGFVPMIHTFSVFMYRRALDQVEMSVAYANLPVRLIGFLPGVTTPGGATHQAVNDVAVLRSLPNMTIIDTGDATDAESALQMCHEVDGPVYVRMIRGEIPRLFDAGRPTRLHEARTISEGSEILLLSSGISTEEALRATHLIRERGVDLHHLHISTLKPFIDQAVPAAINRAKRGVITMENHVRNGGLGTSVAELMMDSALFKPLERIDLGDTYLQGASKAWLMQKYGIDARALVSRVEKLIGKSLDISDEEIGEVRVDTFFSDLQQESL